jgi:hypothetical protein
VTVYLGVYGQVELTRTSLGIALQGTIQPADISTAKDRFSFDFDQGTLITGDLVEFSTTNGSPLAFVDASGWDDSTVHEQGTFFIHVDSVGGIFLYRTFANAVEGRSTGRVALSTIASALPITYTVQNVTPRMLGQTTSWELNTTRENVDVTALGDNYREMYSTLITGNGRISALFDYDDASAESPLYLYHLINRQQLGAAFNAKLSIISRGSGAAISDSIYYEITGILTNCGLALSTDGAISSQFEFITTGPIRLLTGFEADYIVQEQDGISRIKVESGQPEGFLLLEQDL